jgi:hypothetical protein
MLDWISDTIMAVVTYVPALFVDRHSPNFDLIRTMFGLILIAIIVYAIAMVPWRALTSRFRRK